MLTPFPYTRYTEKNNREMTAGHAVRSEGPVLSDVQLLTENTLRYKTCKYISCLTKHFLLFQLMHTIIKLQEC